MFCPKCGQEAGDYTRICPSCGELLDFSSNTSGQEQTDNNEYNNYTGNYNNGMHAQNNPIPQIPDYKVQSILLIVFSCVLCCFSCISIIALPFAIIALITSNKIHTHLAAGNIDLAYEDSRKTKMWCWVSFGILIAAIVLAVIWLVFFSTSYIELIEQYIEQYPYEFNY